MKRIVAPLFLIMLAMAGSAQANETYFSLSFHVFEGLIDRAGSNRKPDHPLVQQAVSETAGLLGYQGTRHVDTKTWLVRTRGDMERALDYRGSTLQIADQASIQFSLLFDARARFLTLVDLELSSGDSVLMRSSLGVEDRGVAVAGVMEPPGSGQEYFIVLSFEVADVPFPGQSDDAVFTVIHDRAH